MHYSKNYKNLSESKIINQKKNQINKILNVLNKCKVSDKNYNSTDKPFFQSCFEQSNFHCDTICLDVYNVPESLNRNIKLIFQLLGDAEREIYIGNWTIMSVNQCQKLYEDYCENNQTNVYDIGFKYMGMGHILVLSCDLESHLLFLRPDGGSNGYDRHYNYQNIIKNGSKSYEKFTFSSWFYKIKC